MFSYLKSISNNAKKNQIKQNILLISFKHQIYNIILA